MLHIIAGRSGSRQLSRSRNSVVELGDPSLADLDIAGVDEAGRGPLAGPVVAAAVILDRGRPLAGVRDSKCLTPARRVALALTIRQRALAWAVAEASVEEIERLNILQASLLAMRRAVMALAVAPARVVVDGCQCPPGLVNAVALVRADATVAAVSAASILAKVHRDALMRSLHQHYPGYGFDRHFGYPTAMHLAALRRLGPSPCHRRSFAPVRALIELGGDP